MAKEVKNAPETKTPLTYPFSIMHAMARGLEVTAQAGLEDEYKATHDKLTGALNREGLERYLESAETPRAMLVVDATNFKSINDRFSYQVGDQVINSTYEVLSESVRSSDVIARWGGDEFVIILNGNNDSQQNGLRLERRSNTDHIKYIDEAKERIAASMKSFLDGHPQLKALNLDLAVGGVVWPGNSSVEALIAEAQKEMKAHKDSQRQNDRPPAA